MVYLGLDLGSKTLGVSVSDRTGIIASSLEVLRYNDDLSKINIELPNGFKIINPFNSDSKEKIKEITRNIRTINYKFFEGSN